MRKLLKEYGFVRDRVITDDLRSYCQGLRKTVFEQGAIRKPRRRIVIGQEANAIIRQLTLNRGVGDASRNVQIRRDEPASFDWKPANLDCGPVLEYNEKAAQDAQQRADAFLDSHMK